MDPRIVYSLQRATEAQRKQSKRHAGGKDRRLAFDPSFFSALSFILLPLLITRKVKSTKRAVLLCVCHYCYAPSSAARRSNKRSFSFFLSFLLSLSFFSFRPLQRTAQLILQRVHQSRLLHTLSVASFVFEREETKEWQTNKGRRCCSTPLLISTAMSLEISASRPSR